VPRLLEPGFGQKDVAGGGFAKRIGHGSAQQSIVSITGRDAPRQPGPQSVPTYARHAGNRGENARRTLNSCKALLT
jgi:hypothetical protein